MYLDSIHFRFPRNLFRPLEHRYSNLTKKTQESARLDQLRLAKKREVKICDNTINLAQATQVAQVAQVSCSGLGPVN